MNATRPLSAVRHAGKRLFVHIGMPKTGSKSIRTLLAQWPAFLERSGVHVPVAGLGRPSGGHAALFESRLGRPPAGWEAWMRLPCDSVAWNDLRDELIRCAARRFVVSWEVLASGRPQASEWAEAFAVLGGEAGVDIEAVAYVRPQYQWLVSQYTQGVKWGDETRRFEAVLEECLGRRAGQGRTWAAATLHAGLDYNRVFAPWREVLGDRLQVFSLAETQRTGGLAPHFLRRIGVNDLADMATCAPRVNQRPGGKLLEVLRLTSAALDAAGIDKLWKRSLLNKVRADLPALLEHDVPFAPLTDAQIDAVIERHAGANAQFAQDYGPAAAFHCDDARTARTSSGSPPPVRFEWQDFGGAERDRVRRYIKGATGVDLDTGRSGAIPSMERTGPRRRSISPGVRLFASQARSVRRPRDAVPFLRWLRWRLHGFLRRRLRAPA